MDTLGKRLQKALDDAGMTQAQLAERLGISQQAVQFICSGRTKNSKHTGRIAEILGVTPEWLVFGTLHGVSESKNNYVATLTTKVYTIRQLDYDQEPTAEAICPFPHSMQTIGFIVEGAPTTNPMHPSSGRAYPTGSIVFAEPASIDDCENGDLVLARLKSNGAHMFRQLYKDHDQQMLLPLNPMFQPWSEPFDVVGKVIGAILP